MTSALFVSVFVIATCGLVYELVASTLASYLLGDTVFQFSTVIGAYLFAMGVGSYLSRFIGRGLVTRFIQVEALVGLLGGFSAALLSIAFIETRGFQVVLYSVVFGVGALVGLEVPLLIRILKDRLELKDLVAQVLALDYVGALAASLLFPLVLMPHLGLLKTCFVFGLANVGVAVWALNIFREELPRPGWLRAFCLASAAALMAGLAMSGDIAAWADTGLYTDDVIVSKQTPYQRIVLTRGKRDLRLFLNGHLQFSSLDEHRYHETLVHPGLASLESPRRVLILGGGDGLAAREVLRYPTVDEVVLVDIDPEVTRLFSRQEIFKNLNGGSLLSRKLRVINADAFQWLESGTDRFDFAIVDLPDPSTFSLGKLYTTAFYRALRARLRRGGLAVVQATSPLFARRSFWCVDTTLRAAGFKTSPYHAYVPSFGEWGFIIAGDSPARLPERLPEGLKFLTRRTLAGLFEFPADMARVPAPPNALNTQALVHTYEEEWDKLNY